jgi:hypothetical protein
MSMMGADVAFLIGPCLASGMPSLFKCDGIQFERPQAGEHPPYVERSRASGSSQADASSGALTRDDSRACARRFGGAIRYGYRDRRRSRGNVGKEGV